MGRMWAALAAAIGLALLPGAVLAQDESADTPQPSGLSAAESTRADWVAKPSGDDLTEAYPPLAQALGVTGRVIMACKVATTGRVEDCRVVSETPKGFGFGEAALTIAPMFRMAPSTAGGSATVSDVRIPIRFALPQGDTAGPNAIVVLQVIGAVLLIVMATPLVAAVNDRLRRRGARTARIGDALERGFGLVGPALRRAPVPLAIYAGVLAAAQMLAPVPGGAFDPVAFGRLMLLLPLLLIGAMMARAAAYRVAFQGRRPADPALKVRRLGLQFGKVEGRLVLALLVLMALSLVGEVALAILGLMAWFAARLVLGAHASAFLLALAPGVFLLAGLLAACRLSTFTAAWVAEGRERLGDSWRATRACLFPPILAGLVMIVLSGLASMAFRLPVQLALQAPELWGARLALALVYGGLVSLLAVVSVGLSVHFYEALQAPEPPEI